MTSWEVVRMVCYTASAPALLYLALAAGRQRQYARASFDAALSLLFVWYMVEISIASSGINTRQYRVIGTPMVVTIAISAVWMVADLWRQRGVRWQFWRRWRHA